MSVDAQPMPTTSSQSPKKFDVQIINDPIHGIIELHPLLSKIINTPQFQRLKDIKQLGVSYWIFPGASHNRFEHSIGTSYLCGKLIDTLKERHSIEENGKIEITDEEALCVKVAGLCHDLGHGPFSHFFDLDYIPKMIPNRKPKWTHEQASCDLFDFMLQENRELDEEFKKHKLEEKEKTFIKDLILGKKSEKADKKMSAIVYRDGVSDGDTYEKSFLYEIVNNDRNGIDCDKFDYFARDCHNVGVRSNFEYERYFYTTRIMLIKGETEAQLQICVRDKEVFNLYELFHTRASLHQRVYQHKTEAPIRDMLAEALSKVDKKFKISSSIDDMERYTNLTDSIIYEILRCDPNEAEKKNEAENKALTEAKKLLLGIQNRQLYKLCGEIYLSDVRPTKEIKKEIKKEIEDSLVLTAPHISAGNSFIYVIAVGRKKDPIESVNFFNKSGDIIDFPKEQLEQMRPASMTTQVKVVRVYAKSQEKEVKECFRKIIEKSPKYHTATIRQKNPFYDATELAPTPTKLRKTSSVSPFRRKLFL